RQDHDGGAADALSLSRFVVSGGGVANRPSERYPLLVRSKAGGDACHRHMYGFQLKRWLTAPPGCGVRGEGEAAKKSRAGLPPALGVFCSTTDIRRSIGPTSWRKG